MAIADRPAAPRTPAESALPRRAKPDCLDASASEAGFEAAHRGGGTRPRKKGMFVKADFTYDAETDVYRCPAGKALTYRYTREEDGLMLRRYWQNDCQHCPLKSRCTTGKERRITRWEH